MINKSFYAINFEFLNNIDILCNISRNFKERILKKYFFVVFLVCLTCTLFAESTGKNNDIKQPDSYAPQKRSLNRKSIHSRKLQKDYSEDDIKKRYLKVDNLSKQKKYSEALKICNKIESHLSARYRKNKDILSAVLLVRSYIVKSKVCYSMNDLPQAVNLTRKAVDLYEKFPYLKQSYQYPKLKSLLMQRETVLNNIDCPKSIEQVHKLYNSGKYDDAEKIILKLLKNAQKDKKADNKFLSLINFLLGRNLITQRKKAGLKPLEKSLYYFSKIKEGKEQFFDDYLTYDIYFFLSHAYNLNNQPENSLKYAKLLHKITFEKCPNDLSTLIKSSITLAFAYKACNDKKNAVKYAKKTLELMKKDPTLKSRLHLIENSIKEWSK